MGCSPTRNRNHQGGVFQHVASANVKAVKRASNNNRSSGAPRDLRSQEKSRNSLREIELKVLRTRVKGHYRCDVPDFKYDSS